jgi:hypothetical protein
VVEISDEEFTILSDLVNAIELDDTAPEELQTKLANALQVINNFGAEQQAPDPNMMAPA